MTVTAGTGTGPCVGATCGSLVDSQRQRIQIAGNAGVPAAASAVVGYLTLTNPTADGYLRLNPDFSTGMGFNGDETVDVNGGEVRNSLVMIPLKADGTIEIVSGTGITTWSLDISGYLSDLAGATTYTYGADGIRTTKASPQGAVTKFTYSDNAGLPLLLKETTPTGTTYLVYGPGGGITFGAAGAVAGALTGPFAEVAVPAFPEGEFAASCVMGIPDGSQPAGNPH